VMNSNYKLGDIVYLYTDIDQLERMVTSITFKANGCVVYELSCGTSNSDHYEIEISKKKNINIALGMN